MGAILHVLSPIVVIPAQAGNQAGGIANWEYNHQAHIPRQTLIPACAGMTRLKITLSGAYRSLRFLDAVKIIALFVIFYKRLKAVQNQFITVIPELGGDDGVS
jgi:hypothetical protein